MIKDEQYREIFTKAETDADVVGFILAGGRGKGVFTENSDYDIVIIVTDEAKNRAMENFDTMYNAAEVIEARVHTLDEFRQLGAWGTDDSWRRYNFAI